MKRVLVANRGEIARRVFRTARRMGLQTVAVYSDADRHALHVREADRAVALGGAAAAESYLRIDALIAAARASGADAVHPGYGFLSANADFAQAVCDAGLTWVGPPPAAIRALGSKAAAKALARRIGVPVLPASLGAAQTEAALQAEAARIGYPLMVKAVAGGGGRGMRWVETPEALAAALHSARSEAEASFGRGDLLLERGLRRPRHLEVQIFADAHGACVHLGERDCSVQRRHQKLIEESPSPAVTPAVRAELGRCAVALAQAAGYVGAGTAEFLLDEDGAFHFMEMNTRLQVEHPVTELRTGLDLVEWQLRIARGEPLPLAQEQIHFSGHAIEVRLCAEDAHFMPQTGRVRRIVAPESTEGLRLDHAIEEGAEVTPHYDAMLGKWIVHAATREAAIERLAHALDATVLLGLPTNRAFLAACLRHPLFRAGEATIPFLAEHASALRASLAPGAEAVRAALVAASLGGRPPAAVLPLPFVRPLRWRVGEQTLDVALRDCGGSAVELALAGAQHRAQVTGEAVSVDGCRRPVWVVPLDARRVAVQWGPDEVELENLSHQAPARPDAGAAARELCARFNGKVVAVRVADGEVVDAGQTLLTLESMKIEHQIAAPRRARIAHVPVAPGQQVHPGQVLIVFDGTPA
jgi:3-methylcrotonyl-CoA carboxylase alpha subunit/geranyl-CoA carboxylase alpha subunit